MFNFDAGIINKQPAPGGADSCHRVIYMHNLLICIFISLDINPKTETLIEGPILIASSAISVKPLIISSNSIQFNFIHTSIKYLHDI